MGFSCFWQRWVRTTPVAIDRGERRTTGEQMTAITVPVAMIEHVSTDHTRRFSLIAIHNSPGAVVRQIALPRLQFFVSLPLGSFIRPRDGVLIA
jgi:predicted alpha/beta hydrolase